VREAGVPRRYTVRLRGRGADRAPALVVEDERGVAYLSHRGWLPVCLIGADAAARLPRLLRGWEGWARVPRVAPYTLDELRRLVGGPPGRAPEPT